MWCVSGRPVSDRAHASSGWLVSGGRRLMTTRNFLSRHIAWRSSTSCADSTSGASDVCCCCMEPCGVESFNSSCGRLCGSSQHIHALVMRVWAISKTKATIKRPDFFRNLRHFKTAGIFNDSKEAPTHWRTCGDVSTENHMSNIWKLNFSISDGIRSLLWASTLTEDLSSWLGVTFGRQQQTYGLK